MIIDGETYACEGCIRGHRTRNCQHKDRPLQHIKAKGRPVSQCNHCRSERKNRSAHVKCQCGKRASEGGSDCGCFSGQKCKCATKKSPKQEAANLGDISENISELPSPVSTLNTASPTPTSISADLQWSEITTPTSHFMPLDGLAQFDPNSWMADPHFDTPVGFDGGSIGQSAVTALSTAGVEHDHIVPTEQQQFMMNLSDFPNPTDWPALDDESTKQLLAMMDSTAGMDMNNFDASTSLLAGGGNPNFPFELDFASMTQHAQPGQQNTPAATGSQCNSKKEKGCGPCCV